MKDKDLTATPLDLSRFCSGDSSRAVMMTPCEIGGLAYATDGHVAVRVAAELAGNPGSTPKALELFNRVPAIVEAAKVAAKTWIQILSLPDRPICKTCNGKTEAPKDEECPECEGDGEVTAETDYNSYEVECKTCKGDGEILGDGVCKACRGKGFEGSNKPVGCDVHGIRLNLDLLCKITDLPGLKIGLGNPKKLDAHYFTWDQGDGVIMPLRMVGPTEMTSDLVFELTADHYRDCEGQQTPTKNPE